MSTLIDSMDRPSGSADAFGRGIVDRGVLCATLAALLLTAASLFGRSHWLLELLTHFRMHFVIGGIVLLFIALARRGYGFALLAAAVAAANLSPMIPYILPGPVEAEASQFEVRIMSANVHFRNSGYAALRAAIERENPDIVGLQEVNGTWVEELSAIRPEYPFTVLRPEGGAYGLALFSRVPLREMESSPYIENGVQTAITVELELQNVPVTMMVVHLMAPGTAAKADLRNTQLGKIAEMIAADRNDEQILVGDLNVTPWSPYYLTLESEAGLVNAARGHGYRPTWPAGLGFLKIPIDHCLLSKGLRVRRFHRGAEIGSDHVPIVVDIAIVEPDFRESS